MSLPKREASEDKSSFISRCMSDPSMRDEFSYEERITYCNLNAEVINESSASEENNNKMDAYKFETQKEAKEMAKKLGLDMIHSHESETGAVFWMPGKDMSELRQILYFEASLSKDCDGCKACENDVEILTAAAASLLEEDQYFDLGLEEEFAVALTENSFSVMSKHSASEYHGLKLPLNKPFRLSNEEKSFGVYSRGENGGVVVIKFGDPERPFDTQGSEDRKLFKSRHNISKYSRFTSAYWSDKMTSRRQIEATKQQKLDNKREQFEILKRELEEMGG